MKHYVTSRSNNKTLVWLWDNIKKIWKEPAELVLGNKKTLQQAMNITENASQDGREEKGKSKY